MIHLSFKGLDMFFVCFPLSEKIESSYGNHPHMNSICKKKCFRIVRQLQVTPLPVLPNQNPQDPARYKPVVLIKLVSQSVGFCLRDEIKGNMLAETTGLLDSFLILHICIYVYCVNTYKRTCHNATISPH